jgi:poly(beta-D-mannuronate) lyase
MYLYRSDSDNVNQQWELTNLNDVSDSPTDYGLRSNVAPSSNFDLEDWYLSIPVNSGGKATSIKENSLASGYEDKYFYTGNDGGMVFMTPIDGAKTSSGTKFTRTELREMLRRGNTSYATDGRENNWAFSSIPSKYEYDFGGIDGVLKATLAVNRVTTTSSNKEQVGRIVIGQIHAEKNEPIRLYYHKLPGNKNGAIYFAHETSKSDGGKETWYNLLGSMVSSNGDLNKTSNPSSGIALNEHFSYNITVNGDNMDVTISQDGTKLASKRVNMSGSGYDDQNNYMYFKAGIYLQDCDDEEKSCDSDKSDYAKATFYELSNKHDNYDY